MKSFVLALLLALPVSLHAKKPQTPPEYKPFTTLVSRAKELDIHINAPLEEAARAYSRTDKLLFHFVAAHNREGEQDFNQMVGLELALEKALEGVKGGYVETYYWDCDWPGIPKDMKSPIDFSACHKPSF